MIPARRPPRLLRAALMGVVAAGCLLYGGEPVDAQSLRGSRASMDRQNRMAQAHDFTYIETPERVKLFASRGWLVPVESTPDYIVKRDVSFPYARPEVELFAERLGRQYKQACNESLVVTSLTRPQNRQPRNASDRTVHPTGMAIDLRYSWNADCRRWIEGVLGSLERQGVLEATLERRPRHYHIAIFPNQYASYVESLIAGGGGAQQTREYTVRNGDSLWKIARAHGITVDELRDVNGIRDSRIFAGQVIDVPQGS